LFTTSRVRRNGGCGVGDNRVSRRTGMKKAVEITLGVVTSIGGFIDAGALATSLQAGARFRYSLLWATLLGTVCAIFLIEMSGRLAAVTKHPLRELIHKRFGFRFSAALLVSGLILNVLVIAAEIGGMSIALELATQRSFRLWAIPVTLVACALLWFLTFGVIEKAVSFAGLVTVAFVVAAWRLHPSASELLAGAVPRLPSHDEANYYYLAVSIIGSIITPFMFIFYSSGAIEEKWNRSYLGVNRAVAILGMSFGALMAVGVIIVAAGVLAPQGVRVENYAEAAHMLDPQLGRWGIALFILSLGICSLGAAVEVGLSMAYELAQTLGWNWGKEQKPRNAARFTLSYTCCLFAGAIPIVAGLDPMKVTVFSMAVVCLALPFITFPFLILMNDRRYLGGNVNRRWSNYAVTCIVALAFVLAAVAIPLQVLGGS
jgi:Mn2+/Fe2+ NRAMP family transporter